MNKRRVTNYWLPLLFLLLLGGCKGVTDSHYRTIPKDATALLSINIEALKEKSEIIDSIRPILEEAAKSDAVIKKILKISDNTKLSGVDLSNKLLIALLADNKTIVVAAKVDNANKLKKTLEEIELTTSVKHKDKKFYATISDGDIIYDNDKLVAVIGNKSYDKESLPKILMEQSTEESILINKDIEKKLSKDDISILFSTANIDKSRYLTKEFYIPSISALIGINFQKGEIDISSGIVANDTESAEYLDKHFHLTHKITKSHLKLFPKSTSVIYISNIDGVKYAERVDEQYRLTLPHSEIFDEELISNLRSIIESFTGEITMGITGFGAMGLPNMLAYADISDNKVLEQIIKLLPKIDFITNIEKLGPNQYRCDIVMSGLYIYIGVIDGLLYVTNDQDIYSNIGKEIENSFYNTLFAKNIPSNSHGYFVMDVESLQKNPVVNMLVGLYSYNLPELKSFFSSLKYLEISGELKEGFIKIKLSNDDDNSLKRVVDALNLKQLFDY